MSDTFQNDDSSSLIAKLLDMQDPATVGLRRILRKKSEDKNDFPLRSPQPEIFDSPGIKKQLSEDEKRVFVLEKQVIDLRNEIKTKEEASRRAIQESYQMGFHEGVSKGEANGIRETQKKYELKIDELQKRFLDLLNKVEDFKQQILRDASNIVLMLSLEIARKIVTTEINQNEKVILETIKKALSFIGDKEKLVIRVSPNDYETVSSKKDFWMPMSDRSAHITIEKDTQIERGGCVLESSSGIADAQIGVQFGELTDVVQKCWQNLETTSFNFEEKIV